MIAYLGTYTVMGGEGIYRCAFDPATGELEILGSTPGIPNPSFLARHPRRDLLYSVSEVREHGERSGGAVHAFRIDADTGELEKINDQPSGGQGPCHVAVSPDGAWVATTNYASGSVALFGLDPSGALRPAISVIQHSGSSAHPERQQGPHAHSSGFSADSTLLYVADLGLDRLMTYRIDRETGMHPASPPWFATHPGAGPRHFDSHPTSPILYLINEIDSTLTTLARNPGSGGLTEIEHQTTLPAGFSGESTTADIHAHPSGRFVYGSNRGHDSIVRFAVDGNTGALSDPWWCPTGGEHPRNFAVAPDGRFLLAANMNSDSIVVFAIDPRSGELSPTGGTCEVPAPVCLRFA